MNKKVDIVISAYCFIEKRGKILLSRDTGKNGWKLSGGCTEKNELIYETILREVREETGFKVKLNKLVYIQEYLKKNGIHRLRIYTSGIYMSGKEKLMPGEIETIRWFSKKELKKLKPKDFFIRQYYDALQRYLAGKSYPLTIVEKIRK